MNGISGKFIGIAIIVLLLITMFSTVVVSEEMMDRRQIASEMSDFADEIIDSRMISNSMETSFTSAITSHGMVVNYQVTRKIRDVSYEDVAGVPTASVNYVTDPDKDPKQFEKGDHVVVRVWVSGYSSTQYIARKLTQIFLQDFDYSIEARVR